MICAITIYGLQVAGQEPMNVLSPDRLKFSTSRVDNSIRLRILDTRDRDNVLEMKVDERNPLNMKVFAPMEHALMDWVRRWIDHGKPTQNERWQESMVRDSEIHLGREKFGGVFAACLFASETEKSGSAVFYRKTFTPAGDYAIIHQKHALDGKFRNLRFPAVAHELEPGQDIGQEADRRTRS